jgi:hypothetical protein
MMGYAGMRERTTQPLNTAAAVGLTAYTERDTEGDSVHAIMRGGSESGITPWLRAVTASSR